MPQLTIAQVKQSLPHCTIIQNGRVYDGKISGRLNQFACVSICGQTMPGGRYRVIMGEIREYAWETVTRIVNEDRPFNFDD